uniref:Uncharacterized protein n=1 Tax=Colletotrichum fructicola (strain Nara gc5) TaxID=1213859 RepID=L2FHQ9_COLFN
MTPYFYVSHLPSSASFYSAVLQPLGLRYISTDTLTAANADDDDNDSKTIITTHPRCELVRLPAAVTYGFRDQTSSPPTPVFKIREARNSFEPLKKSRVVFSAPSPTVVTDFHSYTLRANPALLPISRPAAIMAIPTAPLSPTWTVTPWKFRILNWNYDVAKSSPSRPAAAAPARPSASRAMTSQAGQYSGNEPYTLLRRSVTTSIIETSPSANNDLASSPAKSAAPSSSLQTSTVLGGLLGAAVGAAAGAAMTYTMLKKERAQAPSQEFDGAGPAPPFQRRATFPEQYSDQRPAPRYVEVERTVEKIRYPEAYQTLPDNRVPHQYAAKYSQAGSRAREDVDDDGRSHASRYQLERASTVHSRSQTAVPRAAPLMITDYEHQSNAGLSIAGKSAVPRTVVDDAATYVSARSARSQSTVRPPPPTVETILGGRSTAPSRAPTQAPSIVPSRAPTHAPSRAPTDVRSRAPTAAPSRAPTIAPSRAPTKAPSHAPTYVPSKAPSRTPTKVPVRAPPTIVRAANQQQVFGYPPATRAPTFMPAARAPAPESRAGSRWEDDVVSVAPSDSISCIGSRTSRRQYH